jgi:Xaa-Pro dipeptidase
VEWDRDLGRPGAPDAALYGRHVTEVSARTVDALDGVGRFGGALFHAGSERVYHRDDIAIPFRPHPHFARFAPWAGPDHLMLVRPGEPLRAVRVTPRDYWHAPPSESAHPWREVLDPAPAASVDEALALLGDVSDCAFVGADTGVARAAGIAPDAVEPADLMARLDWHRAVKTPYEIDCHRLAAQRAALGHAAARATALAGGSERAVHAAYLEASVQLENETPYPNIVAWDDRASVLHYGGKRTGAPDPGALLLIDAGAAAWGYASDVTRTHLRSGAPALLRDLLAGMEALQRRLVGAVAPGVEYACVHRDALRELATLLASTGLVRTDAEAALDRGLVAPFLPHGVGHLLGLQVHDVGGLQAAPDGGLRPPPPGCERLRNTRTCEPGHVVTVEPGLYFIPLLLEPLRGAADRDAIDWRAVDALTPFGGIRVEDDVLVTEDGREDLSRPHIPAGAGADGAAPR